IGGMIKARRRALGLSQQRDLAAYPGGVSAVAIHFVEIGKTPGARLTAPQALADALGARLSTLVRPLDRPIRRRSSARSRARQPEWQGSPSRGLVRRTSPTLKTSRTSSAWGENRSGDNGFPSQAGRQGFVAHQLRADQPRDYG